ncbi:hypothetical protein N0V88_006727 [Collariella sp. IMI 366227]|nr:hypothetical protein N0V88_006727 [Collariella sp. IMI 366227]
MLLKDCFTLIKKLIQAPSPPPELAQWEFLSDSCRIYGKKAGLLLDGLSEGSNKSLDSSLATLKKFLIKNLDAGLDGGDLKEIEERLERANDLIRVSPSTAEFFLAGSDFIDGLISCYKITNPPLRKALIATTYLCLMGLAEGQKMSALTDQLYSLKAAAEAHKTGPLNVNDSLVAELVTSTPLIQHLQRKLEASDKSSTRTKSVLAELNTFKKPGSSLSKPKRLFKRKIDKGKGLAEYDEAQAQQEIHVHRMSQISQVQDLFPELGTGFISQLLDHYASNTEEVVAHLLDDSLPPPRLPRPHLQPHPPIPSPTPQLPPPQEEDNLDLLTASSANLHIGKRPHPLTNTPTNKAAILSALAAFDSDDDERDDTYDAADVGGTVDTTPALDASTTSTALPDTTESTSTSPTPLPGPLQPRQ